MTVRFLPTEHDTPAGKLADAELHFDGRDGALTGLKLIGFAVWQHPDRGRRVILPDALRRDIGDRGVYAYDRLSAAILDAFGHFEAGEYGGSMGGYYIADTSGHSTGETTWS